MRDLQLMALEGSILDFPVVFQGNAKDLPGCKQGGYAFKPRGKKRGGAG